VIKLRPPCEVITKCVLPTVRSLVAKKLVEEHGLSQVTTAEKLGTTQAAISQYIYSKRGNKMIDYFETLPTFHNFVNKVVDEVKNGDDSSIDIIPMFCKLCKSLDKEKIHELSK
jgi:predicted transcriptional regulator